MGQGNHGKEGGVMATKEKLDTLSGLLDEIEQMAFNSGRDEESDPSASLRVEELKAKVIALFKEKEAA
jgi:hypothetical protein